MRILVCGAGVIGTIYAARLQAGGHCVTVLARGTRLADIRRHGLVLQDMVGRDRSTTLVDATEQLSPDDPFDLALVTVRRDQIGSIMPVLRAGRGIRTMLFMLNNPTGSTGLVETLGTGQVLVGFPGVGGAREGHVIRYAMIRQQPTTLGEPDGRRTPRLRAVAAAFRGAGFQTRISRDMNAWLTTHAFFVTAVSGAIYLAGGDCSRLSKDAAALELMTRGVREGFGAMRALGLTVTPLSLRVLFTWLPHAFTLHYWRRFFASEVAEYVLGRHVLIAASEMGEVASDCRNLLDRTRVEAPALRRLYRAIDSHLASE